MSLDKAIAHGKEHRRPYTGAKRSASSCRPHGGCPYCERNRLVWRKRIDAQAMTQDA